MLDRILSDLLQYQFWVVTGISLVLLLLIALAILIIQNQRRSQSLLIALRSSLPGPLHIRQEERQGSMIASFEPAPDPFRVLQAIWAVKGRQPKLLLRGKLIKRPHQELLWVQGRPPDRALRRSIDSGLWELRHMDLIDGEFAVRGMNSAGLEHHFFDLQARFGAFLTRVAVYAEEEYEMIVELNINRFNATDLPALLATIRALARATLR